jgi:hypothetical protein
MLKKLKPILYVALGGLALSLLSFFVWIYSNRAGDNLYFGVIENMATSTLTISDRFNGKLIINFDQNTKIFRGQDEAKISELKNNKFVQVIGNLNQNKEVIADTIRIMKAPKDLEN